MKLLKWFERRSKSIRREESVIHAIFSLRLSERRMIKDAKVVRNIPIRAKASLILCHGMSRQMSPVMTGKRMGTSNIEFILYSYEC